MCCIAHRIFFQPSLHYLEEAGEMFPVSAGLAETRERAAVQDRSLRQEH